MRFGIISDGNLKFKNCLHSVTRFMLLVLNNLNKNLLTAKSRDLRSDFMSGQTSVQYNSIGRHLVEIKCKKVSCDAQRPIFPNIEFTARKYLILLFSIEHLKLTKEVKTIPKYFIFCTQEIATPEEFTILEHRES